MPTDMTAERASNLIGLIYDCVLEPESWQATVEELHEAIGLPNCSLSVTSPQAAKIMINIAAGITPEWMERGHHYAQDLVEAWGGLRQVMEFPLGEPVVKSEVVGRDVLKCNRFMREWAAPQGLGDSVAITLAREQGLSAHIAFGIASSSSGLTEQDRSNLRLLAPHLRRAVSISNLLEMRSLVANTFKAALDGFALPILLADENLGIVHTNASAEAMLRDNDPIRLQGGRLTLSHPQTTAALADAVKRAAIGGIELSQRGLGIPAKQRDGSPVVVHVLPLRRTSRAGISQRAVAAVFVAAASSPPQMPAAALALLYDLTPAETRVLELLVEGKTREEIGHQLGIALATTKTHLLRVFDKTGMSRQADLVRLVGSLSLPV